MSNRCPRCGCTLQETSEGRLICPAERSEGRAVAPTIMAQVVVSRCGWLETASAMNERVAARRAGRAPAWEEWSQATSAELARIDDQTTRLLALIAGLLPRPGGIYEWYVLARPMLETWQTLSTLDLPPAPVEIMRSPPWDHEHVCSWFAQRTDQSASPQQIRRRVQRRWRGEIEVTDTRLGWTFEYGGDVWQPTGLSGPAGSYCSSNILLQDGTMIDSRGNPVSPYLNAAALLQMARIVKAPALPAHPEREYMAPHLAPEHWRKYAGDESHPVYRDE